MNEATQRLFFALWPDPATSDALATLAQQVAAESGGRPTASGQRPPHTRVSRRSAAPHRARIECRGGADFGAIVRSCSRQGGLLAQERHRLGRRAKRAPTARGATAEDRPIVARERAGAGGAALCRSCHFGAPHHGCRAASARAAAAVARHRICPCRVGTGRRRRTLSSVVRAGRWRPSICSVPCAASNRSMCRARIRTASASTHGALTPKRLRN